MDKKQKGFTLVEMIIVTVIIGILAGIVITVINIPRVQAKSRDSKRIGDLKRIQTALELYFADNRTYPEQTSFGLAQTVLADDIAPTYMDQIPLDPRNGENTSNTGTTRCMNNVYVHGYYYISDIGGAKYVINAIMELPLSMSDVNQCSNIPNCGDSTGIECGGSYLNPHCYCVQNPM